MNDFGQTVAFAQQYQRTGNFHQAELLYLQILETDPEHADALHQLGLIAHRAGRNDMAVEYLRRALKSRPDFAEAHNSLGHVLRKQGNFDNAIDALQQALRLKPDFALAFNNLGMILHDRGKLEEATTNYRHALSLRPNFARVYNNLGNVLKDQERFEEAIASYRHALRLKPDSAGVYCNLGIVLQAQGMLDEAIDNFQQALRLKPDLTIAHSNLLLCLHVHPNYDSTAIYRETRQWNDRHAEPLTRFRQSHANSKDPARRLRIGYVSPDFRNHAAAHFLMALLSNHDRDQVEVFCYAEVICPDDITERLRVSADVWRVTVGLSDEEVAGLVRGDRIDILVDLALHTGNNRLLAFARKPAPVQLTWCGYPGTTGLSAIDYRLTDPYLDPECQNDSCYSEHSIRLPETFGCYDSLYDEAFVKELPALTSGTFTFGCLNAFCKINYGVLAVWAELLRAVPRSRLLLSAPSGHARQFVGESLKQRGIDERRVVFAGRQIHQQYLLMYNQIDLCLDPFPCNGYITSLDALWMGVPIITLIGKTVVGRAGWSVLSNLGLTELTAQTPEEYIAKASTLARELTRLQHLRATLRDRLLASPLADGKRFAVNVELAYRQMWRKWCRTDALTKNP